MKLGGQRAVQHALQVPLHGVGGSIAFAALERLDDARCSSIETTVLVGSTDSGLVRRGMYIFCFSQA